MLTSLHIENVAVIKSADIEFFDGFTVLTGETGAGKSIIIDSINMLLGNKTSRDIIRSGEQSATVEAIFNHFTDSNIQTLTDLGYPPDDEGCILLRRTVSDDGRSQAKLNGRNITLAVLKEVARLLISIHGQYDSQNLLRAANNILYLDDYAQIDEALSGYAEQYERVKAISDEIQSISKDEREKNRIVEIYQFQIKEIDAAKLKLGEEEELLAKRNMLRNIEKVSKSANFVYRALYSSEKSSAYQLVERSCEALEKITDVMPKATEYIEKLNSFKYDLEDIAVSVHDILSGDYENPDKMQDIVESRLDVINKLEKKYGTTIEEVLAFRNNLKKELDSIVNSQDRLIELQKEFSCKFAMLKELANSVSSLRREAALSLEKGIMNELSFLDMSKVEFKIDIVSSNQDDFSRYTPFGFDTVDFLISTNPGEPLKPLASIASGGELSRITLALKSVLNLKESTQTLIFDEIDTGISGSTSQKIGIKLKQVSKTVQVICVTHSAQIAALSHNHIFVSKHEVGGRTETGTKLLSQTERTEEIARIMGGRDITDTLLKSAKELLDISEKI